MEVRASLINNNLLKQTRKISNTDSEVKTEMNVGSVLNQCATAKSSCDKIVTKDSSFKNMLNTVLSSDSNITSEQIKPQVSIVDLLLTSSIHASDSSLETAGDLINTDDKISETIKVNIEELKDSDELDSINSDMINIVAYYLNIPTDEIKEKLESLGLNGSDLLQPENSSKLVESLYGDNKDSLILNDIPVKDIVKLKDIMDGLKKEIESYGIEIASSADSGIKTDIVMPQNYNNSDDKDNGRNMEDTNLVDGAENTITNSDNLFNKVVSDKQNVIDIETNVIKQEHKQEKIEHQIISKIDVKEFENGKEIVMDLNPKELGKLAFKLIKEGGIYTAHIKVENDKTRQLVSDSIHELKESLESKGISIDSIHIEVKENPHKFNMEQEKQKSAKRIQEIINKHMEEIELEESLSGAIKQSSNSLDLDVLI